MYWDIWNFITVAVVFFGIAALALGMFSAYFGKEKNRTYGMIIAAVGIIVLLVWAYLTCFSNIDPFCNIQVWDAIRDTLLGLIAVLIGVLVAAGIFLVTVLKS